VTGIIGIQTGSTFVLSIRTFLLAHLGWFFLIFLFFSYASYLSRAQPRTYRPLSPIVTAVGAVIGFWIIARALSIVNMTAGSVILSSASFSIENNLHWIFVVVLLLGYLVLAVQKTCEFPAAKKAAPLKAPQPLARTGRPLPHRLYRSGNDKILGGVCGGIGEYLGVDSVIIRLLWVIGTLAWGFGLLLYIIAWIIIPAEEPKKE
jgi:phage shock protein PspC (stress-responsive transcriptional regulator)